MKVAPAAAIVTEAIVRQRATAFEFLVSMGRD
jgi:hypothetical protein